MFAEAQFAFSIDIYIYSPGSSAQGMVLPTIKMDFPTSISVIGIILAKYVQRSLGVCQIDSER